MNYPLTGCLYYNRSKFYFDKYSRPNCWKMYKKPSRFSMNDSLEIKSTFNIKLTFGFTPFLTINCIKRDLVSCHRYDLRDFLKDE